MTGNTHDTRNTTEWLVWAAVLAVAAILLVVVKLQAVDGDSALHTGLVVRLSELPVDRWIAPEWWGLWNLQGLYREHPIGILIPPLLLHKLGYPATQAPLLANAIYQILSLILIQRVAAAMVPAMESRALAWMLQLIPIAFTYRIRANHEQAVLLLFLAALWALEQSRAKSGRPIRWLALLVLSAVALLLVKGIFVAWLFMSCGAWLLIVKSDNGDRNVRAWIGLVIAAVAVIGVIAGYESLYLQATHESFIGTYFERQIGSASAQASWPLIQKLRNIMFYGGRLLWFAFPGSLALLVTLWQRRNAPPSDNKVRRAFVFSVGVSLLYVLLFSLSDRHADRYIFPAYYLLAGCGMVAALLQWPWLRRFAERWDRHHAVLTPLFWLLLFSLNMASGAAGMPRVDL